MNLSISATWPKDYVNNFRFSISQFWKHITNEELEWAVDDLFHFSRLKSSDRECYYLSVLGIDLFIHILRK